MNQKEFDEKLDKYARLVVESGINVQKGQPVLISTPIEGADFARRMTKAAYEAGAKRVYVDYSDEYINKMMYEYGTDETLSDFPEWIKVKHETLIEQNVAYISIHAANPNLMKDIPAEKIVKYSKAAGEKLKRYRQATSNSEVSWCVVSIPTPAWSQKVFPEAASAEEAMAQLWEKIFDVNRINEEDPVAAWKAHTDYLAERCKILNEKNIKVLHYKGPGTDFHVELPEGYIWEGGGEYNGKGTYFIANMPTEEVYTMPHKYRSNGTLKATKPLNSSGNLIEDFSFTIKEGKIVEVKAAKGQEVLEKLIATDEGAAYLGEVAIVPQSCPVAKTNTLFYNTLFDENAACHFAFGTSYPTTLKDGTQMSDEELEKHGANVSMTHVDFMVGSEELSIEAETRDGQKFEILKNGEWAF